MTATDFGETLSRIPGSENFSEAVKGGPKEIAEKFEWANHLSDLPRVDKGFIEFVKRNPAFPLKEGRLTDFARASLNLTDQVWKILFPQESPLLYHDLFHAKITGITALELVLGGIVNSPQLQGISNLGEIIRAFSAAAVLHEVDDWWDSEHLSGLKKVTGYDVGTAKELIMAYLGQYHLSIHDFNRFLKLDQFAKTPKEALKEAKELPVENGFLPIAESDSLIDGFPEEQRELLWQIFSDAINAADFLQVVNLGYIQPAEIQWEGDVYSAHCGPVALAWEMNCLRPKALPLEWKDEEGGVDWSKVKLTKRFLEKVALPRIEPGWKWLELFDSEKCQRAQKSWEEANNRAV